MKKRTAMLALGLVACAVLAAMATAAGSTDPPLRDVNGRPITPGTEVAQLTRGADGKCHGPIDVEAKRPAGETGRASVVIDVNEQTCKAFVARVMVAPVETVPPTEHEQGGGMRQP